MKSRKTLNHFAIASIVLTSLNLIIIFLCIPAQHTIMGLISPQTDYFESVIPYTSILSGAFSLIWVITFCLLLINCKNASAKVMLLIAILSEFILAICEYILRSFIIKYYVSQGTKALASFTSLTSAISLLTYPTALLSTIFVWISFGIAIAIQTQTEENIMENSESLSF